MFTPLRSFRVLLLILSLTALGCHAQAPSASSSQKLSPDLARRIEVTLRSHAHLPPGSDITVGAPVPSDIPGYLNVPINISIEGETHTLSLLLSNDHKTLAQFTRYDISLDPKLTVSGADRPARGGPDAAPVLIVVFDDLECPYCAKMHQEIFPALLTRYGDQVHIVYRDYPLHQHPWAMRAAVDVNCLASQSGTGYWNEVDYIHAHAADIGVTEGAADKTPTLAHANDQLDTLTRDEGKHQKVNASILDACLAKQDQTAIEASVKMGNNLGVDSTPTLYINGDKIDGALPIEFVYKIIDNALVAAGRTPPPPAAGALPAKNGKQGN